MKIGIFLDNFFDAQKYKDPGVIASTLSNLGHEIIIYCFNTNSKELDGVIIKKIKKDEWKLKSFWKNEPVDYIIFYSWLSLRFSSIIKSLKLADKKVILKLDTDGHLIYPLKPTYLRTFGRSNHPKQLIIHVARLLQWSLFFKLNSKKRIEQLELSDAAILESPMALDNLKKSLEICQRKDLTNKLVFIPDPVNFDIINNEDLSKKKNIIICSGRWNDKQKNKTGLIKVLSKKDLSNWELVLIGNKSNEIKTNLKKKTPNLVINAIENIDHSLIGGVLKNCKIFFAPSNHESFNLAAAESLCFGCSLAGTPIESFFYFSNKGEFGTVSKSFKIKDIRLALEREIEKWNNNEYNPEKTARYWKEQLSPFNIGLSIEKLIKEYEN